MKKSVIAVACLLLLFFDRCTQVPVTGRSQLNLVSNSELLDLSFQQYDEVLSTSNVIAQGGQAQLVKDVGQKIQIAVEKYMNDNGYASSLEGFAWDYNLIDNDSTVNAWCMPGGKVAFYTGIMPLCQDEPGVAVVMGHEVAHAIASHGRERMSQGLLLNLGLGSIQVAMGQNPSVTQQVFMQAIGGASQLGILAYSRKHESEADKIGLIFMAIAGYDPREAPKFWERMAQASGGAPPEWLSTHPSNERRIQDLNDAMDEALQYYNK